MSIKYLFDKLIFNGGAIVSTASLSPADIDQARAENRMYIDLVGHGFVWLPKEKILDWTINDNQTTQP